jgi:hypothetical protein
MSSSDAEESLLDFSDGSSDDYQPNTSEESSSDEAERGISTLKRKVRNESKWQRNVQKRRRAKGKEYTNVKGNIVPPRVTGPNCLCKYKCFEYISEAKRKTILKNFNSLGDKHKQDIYLAGLITSKVVARRRPKSGEGTKRNFANVYTIKIGSFERKVCKKAFASFHGLSSKRVQNIASHLNENNCTTARLDKRGQHGNRPNRIPETLIEQVNTHIRSFPRRVSHYSRRDSAKFYLSPELNIKLMHRLYLQTYEPEMYAKLMSGDKNGYKPVISHDFYYRYLKANFNLTFGSPRSDTCVTCDKLENQLKNQHLSAEEVERFKVEKQLHLLKADTFYKKLKEQSLIAKENPEVDVLSFDYQQNFPLPKVPSGEAFYCRQLWVYNQTIHSAKTKNAHCYMFDETSGCKKPNETVSFLDHYVNNVLDEKVKELVIFSDNCTAQNKNYTLVQYFYNLVKCGRIRKITHHYPVPGHSFLPCDRCFGIIEKKLRNIERVFVPDEYHVHISNASKQFKTIHVTQEMILDFSSCFQPFFKKSVFDEQKEKFFITKYKVFEYSDTHSDELWVSKDMNFVGIYKFKLLKPGVTPCLFPANKMYSSRLPMKAAKHQDVMKLAQKFVPANDMWFYNSLPLNLAVNGNSDEETENQDEDLE